MGLAQTYPPGRLEELEQRRRERRAQVEPRPADPVEAALYDVRHAQRVTGQCASGADDALARGLKAVKKDLEDAVEKLSEQLASLERRVTAIEDAMTALNG
jgi:hypothetical protein